jgi:alkylation response protein AidB-like acyl-CoA dehydrogenase
MQAAFHRPVPAPEYPVRFGPDSARPSAAFERLDEATRQVAAAAAKRAAHAGNEEAWPAADVAALRAAGLLHAPLPASAGGLGLGTTPEGALPLAGVLRRIGRASLALGRLYEGHVNAIRLLVSYGGPAQLAIARAEADVGRLLAVWNSEGKNGLRLHHAPDGTRLLAGAKTFCSGAGDIPVPLVTAATECGPQMLLADLGTGDPDKRADLAAWTAAGMRASRSGTVDFTGCRIPHERLVGHPGDYPRQPLFSGGAWRFAAVQLGGIEALTIELQAHLRQADRDGDPHQRARYGQALLATETARLWVERAALRAEAPLPARSDAGEAEAERVVAYVNLARLAVEQAGLEVLELVQRSVGLAAFVRGSNLERIARDLQTYLRQPAPDRALDHAAAFHLAQPPGTLPHP